MKKYRVLIIGLVFAACLLPPSLLLACGSERWPVKVATDQMNGRIDETPVPTTIQKLTSIDAPVNPKARKNSRYAPTELTVYEVTAVLTLIKREKDQDYHLVLEDPKHRTMIVESPSPDCADGSRFADEINGVRQAIETELGTISKAQKLHRVVTVTGVGFFDPIHGQTGVAPNGIELHPLLSIDFHPDSSVERLRTRLRKGDGEADD